MTTTWWLALLVNGLPFIFMVIVFLILLHFQRRRGIMAQTPQTFLTEVQRQNALLERIAIALEKQESGS